MCPSCALALPHTRKCGGGLLAATLDAGLPGIGHLFCAILDGRDASRWISWRLGATDRDDAQSTGGNHMRELMINRVYRHFKGDCYLGV